MRLGKTAFVHFGSQVVVSVAGFVATFVIARIGGADVFGLYSVAVALTFWLTIPATAVSDAMTKRISEGHDRSTFLGTGFLLEGGIAVVLGLLVVAASPVIGQYVTAPVGPVVGLLVATNVVMTTTVAALKGEKRVAASGVLMTVERIVRSILHIGLILLGYRVTALIAGHVGAMLVAVAIGLFILRVDVGAPSLAAARSLLEYARFSWLSKLKTRAFGWMDTIVLAAFAIGPSFIGVYEVAWNIASVFALIAVSVRSTLFPEMSEMVAQEGREGVHHLLNEGMVFAGVFMIPGLFGAAVLGREVLQIYGTEFTAGTAVIVILVFARLLVGYGDQLLNVANAVDRPDVAFRVNALFVASNLVLNVALVAWYGWRGAAVATAVSGCVLLVSGYVALSRLVGRLNIPWTEIGKQFVASGLMAAVVVGLKTVFPRSHYVTVALVVIGAGVYALALIALSNRVQTKVTALLPARVAP